MAGRGPAPKDPAKRARRNADTAPAVELEADATIDAPPLPNADGLRQETRDWYATWAGSPQAAQFLSTDWLRLHMLAHLVDAYFAAPSTSLLGEIRLNEQKLGGTPEDRLRLRWRLARADRDSGPPAQPAPSEERKRADPRLKLVEGAA